MRGRSQLDNQLTGLGDLRLRKANSRDERFLQQLFRSNRPHLTQIPMPAEFVDALVQQQYELQRDSYDREFPGYLNFVIVLHQESIGNLKLHQDAQAGCLRLLDIALHPEHRGRGHGGTLLRSLQTLAAHKDWVLRLSVDHQNWQAKKLYESLGFQVVNTAASHAGMAWKAGWNGDVNLMDQSRYLMAKENCSYGA